jgi:hypothetical protein
VERIPTNEFTNEDVYAFARELEKLHPDNRSLRTATIARCQIFGSRGLPPSSDFGATSRPLASVVKRV